MKMEPVQGEAELLPQDAGAEAPQEAYEGDDGYDGTGYEETQEYDAPAEQVEYVQDNEQVQYVDEQGQYVDEQGQYVDEQGLPVAVENAEYVQGYDVEQQGLERAEYADGEAAPADGEPQEPPPEPEPERVVDHKFENGRYRLLRRAAVRQDAHLRSPRVGTFKENEIVNIIDVVVLDDNGRVRGRVNRPRLGWITLGNQRTNQFLAEEIDEDVALPDDHNTYQPGERVKVRWGKAGKKIYAGVIHERDPDNPTNYRVYFPDRWKKIRSVPMDQITAEANLDWTAPADFSYSEVGEEGDCLKLYDDGRLKFRSRELGTVTDSREAYAAGCLDWKLQITAGASEGLADFAGKLFYQFSSKPVEEVSDRLGLLERYKGVMLCANASKSAGITAVIRFLAVDGLRTFYQELAPPAGSGLTNFGDFLKDGIIGILEDFPPSARDRLVVDIVADDNDKRKAEGILDGEGEFQPGDSVEGLMFEDEWMTAEVLEVKDAAKGIYRISYDNGFISTDPVKPRPTHYVTGKEPQEAGGGDDAGEYEEEYADDAGEYYDEG